MGSLLILALQHYEELSKDRTQRRLPDSDSMLYSIQNRELLVENDVGCNRIPDWRKMSTLVYENDAADENVDRKYFDLKGNEYHPDFVAFAE